MTFVLFAEPRTGSSSLLKCLQAHSSLEVMGEPFNHNWVNWAPDSVDYRKDVHDCSSLHRTLDRLFDVCDGFKVSGYQLQGDEVGGLPRSIDQDLVGHLLRREDICVVYLRCRNLLQQVVSGLIAQQTGLWHREDAEGAVEAHYRGLMPLDVDDVGSRVAILARDLQAWEAVLEGRQGGWLRVDYEDFYFGSAVEQQDRLRAVCALLAVEPLDPNGLAQYLRPEVARLNTAETYSLVPDLDVINQRHGSDENGWLFSFPGTAP